MNIPLTQTKAWADLQSDLGKSTTYQHTRDYTFLAIDESTPVGHYLYLPYGPVYASPKGFQKALAALQKLARKKSDIFIRIEPQDPKFPSYAPPNAKKSHDLNPADTWRLDLSEKDESKKILNPQKTTSNQPSSVKLNSIPDQDAFIDLNTIPDALKAKIPPNSLRQYRNRHKKGIIIEATHDPNQIKELVSLQRELAAQKGFNVFSESYLKTELAQPFSTLFVVRQIKPFESIGTKPESNLLAAYLIFDDSTTRYNLQGAQSNLGRQLHVNNILTTHIIFDAYQKGLEIFDFWGIAPEDAPANHPWAGFTAFKKAFIGYPLHYAGTYDLVLDPAKYHLYQLLRRANRLRRKIKI